MTAPILPFDAENAARAAALLAEGGLVVFPTETVYGLGADARSDAALARLYAAKGRPRRNPLIVHAPDLDAAAALGRLDRDALALAEAFWPGPLTIVAPRRDETLSTLVSAGGGAVGLRTPQAPLLRELIAEAGGAVAAPSANPSGRLSPTTAEAAAEGLGAAVDLILDGGPCPVGLESTIVACLGEGPVLLREGGVPREALALVLGDRLRIGGAPLGEGDALPAPGQLSSHYAPRAGMRLGAEAPGPGEAYLAFGPEPEADPAKGAPVRNLSRRGDLAEAAANLFAHLRALDAALGGEGRIAVAPIPEIGLGRAINDRLRRAAAPREPIPSGGTP